MTKHKQVQFAQFLRGPAVLLVVISHFLGGFWHSQTAVSQFLYSSPLALENVSKPPAFIMENSLLLGQLGVGVFFLISGFVIPFSLERYSKRKFAIKRILRIYPVYIVCLSFSLIAILIVADREVMLSAGDMIRQALILSRLWWQSPMIDPVVWTLEIELHFYALLAVVWPLIMKFRMRALWLLAASLLVISFFLYSGFIRHGLAYSYGRIFVMTSYMLAGTAINLLFHGHAGRREVMTFCIAILLGFAVVMSNAIINKSAFPQGPIWNQWIPAYLLAMGIFVACYASRGWFETTNKTGKWASVWFMARISYPLYAVHAITGYAALHFLIGEAINPYFSVAIVTGFVMLLSYLVHLVVEKPAMAASFVDG